MEVEVEVEEEEKGERERRQLQRWRWATEVTEAMVDEVRAVIGYRGWILSKMLPATTQDNTKDNAMSSCTSSKGIDMKKVLRLLPIRSTCLTYTIAWAKARTLFTKQVTTVDKSIGHSFQLPSASIRMFIPISNTLVEKRRLEIARNYGLIGVPNAKVPMSFWWLVPQNAFSSLAYAFTQMGLQESFYDQVPTEFRSLRPSLSYGAVGVGNFLSSFLIYLIDKTTSRFCTNR
ncbi:protein NRT1/ PTR FAMILY 5.10-like [Coffea eugenioides]|uniref:protein NRT1/ PTR FAMILY 5.10-like n=1 Tax=Coffea eugenioides TaxID=49369 RepID=UPI000F612AF5|nr:protein NRT1/ PTR FAMILY 5.10-like [Coffea eugenioides]